MSYTQQYLALDAASERNLIHVLSPPPPKSKIKDQQGASVSHSPVDKVTAKHLYHKGVACHFDSPGHRHYQHYDRHLHDTSDHTPDHEFNFPLLVNSPLCNRSECRIARAMDSVLPTTAARMTLSPLPKQSRKPPQQRKQQLPAQRQQRYVLNPCWEVRADTVRLLRPRKHQPRNSLWQPRRMLLMIPSPRKTLTLISRLRSQRESPRLQCWTVMTKTYPWATARRRKMRVRCIRRCVACFTREVLG
jgi:hypothetical protein